jgi:hypothetical protein
LLQYAPGAQLPTLLASQGWATLQEATLPLIQTVVLLTLGRIALQGKSI